MYGLQPPEFHSPLDEREFKRRISRRKKPPTEIREEIEDLIDCVSDPTDPWHEQAKTDLPLAQEDLDYSILRESVHGKVKLFAKRCNILERYANSYIKFVFDKSRTDMNYEELEIVIDWLDSQNYDYLCPEVKDYIRSKQQQ